MPLVVEDGSAKADGDAYVDVVFCDTYHAARGNAGWTGTTAAKEAAILKATSFIEARFGHRWRGYKVAPLTRKLSWPRQMAEPTAAPALVAIGWYRDEGEFQFAPDEVPLPLIEATAEAALRALASELDPDLDRGGQVASESISVGGISTSISYRPGAPARRVYSVVEGLLRPLMTGRGSQRVVRRA